MRLPTYHLILCGTLVTALISFNQPPHAATTDFKQPNAYAVVVGISNYREEIIPKVPYAIKDVQDFSRSLEIHGGIPKSHIKVLTDAKATIGDFRNHLGEWLRMRVKPDSVVYFYYSGHGAPNPITGEAYIVPWDGHPDFSSGLYPLTELYETLGKLKAKDVVVILDSCFSGNSGRSLLPKGARPIGISIENSILATGRVMVLSAASGNQISSDYDKVQHGLFTHYILMGLQGQADENNDAVVTVGELYSYVRRHVASTAVEELNREQTPTLLPTEETLGARVSLPLAWRFGGGTEQDFAKKGIEVVKAPSQQLFGQPLQEIIGRDGAPMVLVEEGQFMMGSNEYGVEKIPHAVYLDSFYMDKYEVTTSRYAKFLDATGRRQPYKWSEINWTLDGQRAVIGVDWYDADAYCRWAGKRLPTEAEWEKSARGADSRKYPWGSQEPTTSLANYDWDGRRGWEGYGTVSNVGNYDAGKSPYGIYDMAGNVWEWVADWYNEQYYRNSPVRNPKGPPEGKDKVIRGGSWNHRSVYLRSSFRLRTNPGDRSTNVGFRCASSLYQKEEKP